MAKGRKALENPLNAGFETFGQKGDKQKRVLEEDMVREMKHRFESARAASSQWRTDARRAYNYYENAQRPPEIDDYDDVLYLTLNLVRSRVDTANGILTKDKPRADLIGRGIEDVEVAAAFKDLLEYSADEDHMDNVTEEAVAHFLKCGFAVIEEELDPDEEQGQLTRHGWVKGKLRAQVGDGLRYYIDPKNRTRQMWGKYGPNWYFTRSQEAVADLMMRFPLKRTRLEKLHEKPPSDLADVTPAIDDDYEGYTAKGVDDSDDSSERAEVRLDYRAEPTVWVYTHWFLRTFPEQIVYEYDENGRLVRATDPDNGDTIEPENLAMMAPEIRDNYQIMTHIVREVWTAAYTEDILLYCHKSPYKHNRWPAVFLCGTMHRDRPMPYGLIHNLFDAQDLYNKLNSVILDNALRSNNSGWILEDGAMDIKEEERLRDEGSAPGFIAKVRMGRRESLDRIEPGDLPRGLWEIQRDVRQTFDELSSLYQTQRGGMPYDTSGKAVIALQNAADMALTDYQRAIEIALTDWGRKRLSNIQQFYTYERTWRISSKVRDIDHYLYTQLEKPTDANGMMQMNQPAQLSLYRLEDGNPEEQRLVDDFTAPAFDLKYVVGSGHERSRDQKLKEAQFLYESGAVDHPYLLQEFEVEGRSEILKRMEEKDPLLKAGKQLQEIMKNPQHKPLVEAVLQDPNVVINALEMAGIDPQNIAGSLAVLTMGAPEGGAGIGGEMA